MKNTSNLPYKTIVITSFFLFVIHGIGLAQTEISINRAYEKALVKNPEIHAGQLKIEFQEKLKNASSIVDPLSVAAEVGQFNSEKTDNKISVAQNFRLPNFYKHQKQVWAEDLKLISLQSEIQKWQLKKNLTMVFNELWYQDEKEKLLQKTDSIYAAYYKRAELRLKKGESNILEKTTAENYRSQASIQLKNIQKDRDLALYQLNYLIAENSLYTHEKGGFYQFKLLKDEERFNGNSLLIQELEQAKNIEAVKLKAERSKLSPSFSLGINSMTMAGTGNDDGKRFQSGMVGIGIPIFNSAQKSIIEAQKINQKIAENNMQIGIRSMKNRYEQLISEYQKLNSEKDYLENKGKINAKTILTTANRLYYEGEINYLEWSILINQSLEIENKVIENQKLLNETIIELNHWKGKL
ncbi:MAG: TolC family protein [Bacteroidetes bacterium]|nr:TolC family protein [Bacteroidota bacterium]